MKSISLIREGGMLWSKMDWGVCQGKLCVYCADMVKGIRMLLQVRWNFLGKSGDCMVSRMHIVLRCGNRGKMNWFGTVAGIGAVLRQESAMRESPL